MRKYRITSKLVIDPRFVLGYHELCEEFHIEYKVWGFFWKRYDNGFYPFTTYNLESAQKQVDLLIKTEQLNRTIKQTPIKIYAANESA